MCSDVHWALWLYVRCLSIRIYLNLSPFLLFLFCSASFSYFVSIAFFVLSWRSDSPHRKTRCTQRWKKENWQTNRVQPFRLSEKHFFCFLSSVRKRLKKKKKKKVIGSWMLSMVSNKITILWGSHSIMRQLESQSYQFTPFEMRYSVCVTYTHTQNRHSKGWRTSVSITCCRKSISFLHHFWYWFVYCSECKCAQSHTKVNR